jgi:hypothetical protein
VVAGVDVGVGDVVGVCVGVGVVVGGGVVAGVGVGVVVGAGVSAGELQAKTNEEIIMHKAKRKYHSFCVFIITPSILFTLAFYFLHHLLSYIRF